MSVWTAGKVLAWASEDFRRRGFSEPRLEAEVLLSNVLGCGRIDLYTGFDRPLVEGELRAYREVIARRRDGEPAAYITGRREFWSLEIEVDPRVLVPRPETETLVEAALARIIPGGRLLDLCTGSGCVAIALATELKDSEIDAVDISGGACEVARNNADRHGVTGRVSVFEGDLFSPLPAGSRYAAVVANPPYVRSGEIPDLAPEVQREPRLALDAGPDGLDVIRRIVAGAPEFLEPDGWLFVEVDPGQVEALVTSLGPASFHTRGQVVRDLAGQERVVAFRYSVEAGPGL